MGASSLRRAETAARILAISFILGAAIAPTVSFAGPCPKTIAGCGCAIVSRGRFSVDAPLSQPGAGDCIAIRAGGVELDLAGNSIAGPSQPALRSNGIHVMGRARGVTIVGGGATISQFTNGILIEGEGASVSGFTASGNAVGVVVSGHAGELTNFSSSNNSYAGVVLFKTPQSRLSDFTANQNVFYGVDVLSTNDRLTGFTADSNGYAGVVIGQVGECGFDVNPPPFSCNRIRTGASGVVGGALDDNGAYGILLFKSQHNQIVGNSASGNGSDDLYDSIVGCGGNQWFGNSFASANRDCID